MDVAQKNYEMCLSGADESGRQIVWRGLQHYVNTWVEPAIGIWDACGADVVLHHCLTNTCDRCGADYNLSGQRLVPRSQWGEETGESLADIMAANISIHDDPSRLLD